MIKYQISSKGILLIFVIFLNLFAINVSIAENRDTVTVKDLAEDFLVYDPQYSTYVPFTGERGNSKSLYLDFNPYRGYYFQIHAIPGVCIFLDQKLVYENTGSSNDLLMLEVDRFIPVGTQKHLLTFYHKEGELPATVRICAITNEQVFHSSLLWKTRPGFKVSRDLIFYLFVLIIILLVILKNRFSRHLLSTIGVGQNGSNSDSISMLGFFTLPMFLLILFNSLGFTFIFAESGFIVPYIGPVENVAITAVVFVGLFYVKYFYLELLGLIFQFSGIVKSHFNEIIRVALYMNLLLVPVFALFYFSELLDWSISYIGFLVVIIGGMIFTIGRLLVMTFSMPQFNYVYLFSYLCIAEIIPLAFVIKITLLSNLDL